MVEVDGLKGVSDAAAARARALSREVGQLREELRRAEKKQQKALARASAAEDAAAVAEKATKEQKYIGERWRKEASIERERRRKSERHSAQTFDSLKRNISEIESAISTRASESLSRMQSMFTLVQRLGSLAVDGTSNVETAQTLLSEALRVLGELAGLMHGANAGATPHLSQGNEQSLSESAKLAIRVAELEKIVREKEKKASNSVKAEREGLVALKHERDKTRASLKTAKSALKACGNIANKGLQLINEEKQRRILLCDHASITRSYENFHSVGGSPRNFAEESHIDRDGLARQSLAPDRKVAPPAARSWPSAGHPNDQEMPYREKIPTEARDMTEMNRDSDLQWPKDDGIDELLKKINGNIKEYEQEIALPNSDLKGHAMETESTASSF